jgi:hypothetical protein
MPKTIEDIATGLYFFIIESWNRTRTLAAPEAIAEYYLHLASNNVDIHRERLQNDVARFVQNCLSDEDRQFRAFRESQGGGLLRENVQRGRELCANEPGC